MSNADAKFTIDDHVEKMLARMPSMHDDSTLLRGMLSIYSARIQILDNVLRGITADALFSISTAIGVQLDQVGTIVGIAREERTDDEYRIILRTQALLVLPERRTQARLMEIVRSLMDTDPGAIIYSQIPPKTYKLTIATASLSTLLSWVPILRRTRPASYVAILGWTAATHITYGDESGVAVPKTWNGYGDSSGTVTGPWGGYGARIDF
jgi:hypothetical protein